MKMRQLLPKKKMKMRMEKQMKKMSKKQQKRPSNAPDGDGFSAPRRPARAGRADMRASSTPTGYSGRWEALNLLSDLQEEEAGNAEDALTEAELDALGAWDATGLNVIEDLEDSYAAHRYAPGDEIIPFRNPGSHG